MRNLLFILFLWSTTLAADGYPLIIDPAINATPPGASVTAGYLTLLNNTDQAITITGAYSPTISKVEIHLTSIKNDVASMEKQSSVTIEAGEKLEFKHGSYHLMLMNLTKPLKESDQVDIIFVTTMGDMLVEMPVLKAGTIQSDQEHDQDHAEMEKKEKAKMAIHEHEDMKKDGEKHAEKTKVVH